MKTHMASGHGSTLKALCGSSGPQDFLRSKITCKRCLQLLRHQARLEREQTNELRQAFLEEHRHAQKIATRIHIDIDDGLIQRVTGIPNDTVIEVFDYEPNDIDHPHVIEDPYGVKVFANYYFGEKA